MGKHSRLVTSDNDLTRAGFLDILQESVSTTIGLFTRKRNGKGLEGVGFKIDNSGLVRLVDQNGAAAVNLVRDGSFANGRLPETWRLLAAWQRITPDGYREAGGQTSTVSADGTQLVDLSAMGFQQVLSVTLTKISSTTSGSGNQSHSLAALPTKDGFTIVNDGVAGPFLWRAFGF